MNNLLKSWGKRLGFWLVESDPVWENLENGGENLLTAPSFLFDTKPLTTTLHLRPRVCSCDQSSTERAETRRSPSLLHSPWILGGVFVYSQKFYPPPQMLQEKILNKKIALPEITEKISRILPKIWLNSFDDKKDLRDNILRWFCVFKLNEMLIERWLMKKKQSLETYITSKLSGDDYEDFKLLFSVN